jgi:excisionase family DNA binding protein
MKLLLKLKVVAERMDCSLSNVYNLVASGELPVHRVGLKKGLRVSENDLEAYLAKVRRQYVVEPPEPVAAKPGARAGIDLW